MSRNVNDILNQIEKANQALDVFDVTFEGDEKLWRGIKQTVGVHNWRVWSWGTAEEKAALKLTAEELKLLESYRPKYREGQEAIRELLALMPGLADMAAGLGIDGTSIFDMSELDTMSILAVKPARQTLKILAARIKAGASIDLTGPPLPLASPKMLKL